MSIYVAPLSSSCVQSPREKTHIGGLFISGLLAFLLMQPQAIAQLESIRPINIVFDTDIWSDIDDAMALAMLHALQERHEINLLAITISVNNRWCASYVDLVNTFYGHSQIPIGVGGLDMESLRKNTAPFRKQYPNLPWPVTRYTQHLSERKRKDNSLVYPRRPLERVKVPEAVTLLRKILLEQPDQSVVMIQTGYSTNLARLLESKPDVISKLNGHELVAAKVRLLSMMAGNFRQISPDGKALQTGAPEANLVADVSAAQKLFANWPTPIVVSGFEVGMALPYPREGIEHDFSFVDDHPIAETFRYYCEEQRKISKNLICPHEHPTFDLTSVLYAARPDRNYFALSKPGSITVLDDGSSTFKPSEGGRDRYLILNAQQKSRTLEAMVMLVTQPPSHRIKP